MAAITDPNLLHAGTRDVEGGSNPAAAGIKNIAPLDYAMLVHQYDLYNSLQPDFANAIREAVQHLQNPDIANQALRAGLISSVPKFAAGQAAGLQAYGASPEASAGAYLHASNSANEAANTAEAQAASPGGNMARLSALSQTIGLAKPNPSSLIALSGAAGPAQSGPGFLGGLASGLTQAIPYIGGLGKMGAPSGGGGMSQNVSQPNQLGSDFA